MQIIIDDKDITKIAAHATSLGILMTADQIKAFIESSTHIQASLIYPRELKDKEIGYYFSLFIKMENFGEPKYHEKVLPPKWYWPDDKDDEKYHKEFRATFAKAAKASGISLDKRWTIGRLLCGLAIPGILKVGNYEVVEWIEHAYGKDPVVICDDGVKRVMWRGLFHD